MALVIGLLSTGASQSGQLSERGEAVRPSYLTEAALRLATGSQEPRSERCHARKGLRFYQVRASFWAHKMGAGKGTRLTHGTGTCPRFAARIAREKARAARRTYERWHVYHYRWDLWMSDKFQRIGACETGYGKRPGDFKWNSGTYQGFAGFYYGTWDAYKPRGAPSEAFLATPREQYQCALNVLAAHGYGAWGCGSA